MSAIIIVDAFWGDAGKGKFAAYLSQRHDAQICVRAGIGPNAGHSVYLSPVVVKNRMLPLGLVNKTTLLMIGSGVAIDPGILLSEIEETQTHQRVFVDYRCPVIELKHVEIETQDKTLKLIDSTKSGSGASRADHVMRRGRRAKDVPELARFLGDVAQMCNDAAEKGVVVVEGSQATFLSLYLSDRYPYTTSDNCTTAAFIDDVGLNWRHVERVVLLVKCLPTAVGSGPIPNEMSTDEIIRRNLVERGTNTGRWRRRSREIDFDLLRYSVMLNGPTEIALTYCEQYDDSLKQYSQGSAIPSKIASLVRAVEAETGVQVRYLEIGKQFPSILELW